MFLTFYDLVKYFFGLAILIFLTFCDLFAQTGELRRPVQGIRNLGMGNAGIALSFDENALYYNPAGLASVDTILVGFPILNEVSEDSIDIINDISKLGSDPQTEDVVSLLMGKKVHYRSLLDLNLVLPFGELITFSVAGGLETQLDLSVRNPVSIEVEFGLRIDRFTNAAIALPIARGRYLIGAGGETIERCDIPLSTATIGTVLSNSNLSDSFGSCDINNLKRAQTFNFGFPKTKQDTISFPPPSAVLSRISASSYRHHDYHCYYY